MNAVVPREKLAAVLGMLGSDHAGERAAAALIAARIAREAGLTWSELLAGSAEKPATPTRTHPHWREMLAAARRHPERLSEWERRFIASIGGEQRSLSRKQWAILARLFNKVAA